MRSSGAEGKPLQFVGPGEAVATCVTCEERTNKTEHQPNSRVASRRRPEDEASPPDIPTKRSRTSEANSAGASTAAETAATSSTLTADNRSPGPTLSQARTMPLSTGNACRNGGGVQVSGVDANYRQVAACSNANGGGHGDMSSNNAGVSNNISNSTSNSNGITTSFADGRSTAASRGPLEHRNGQPASVNLPSDSAELDIIRIIGQHLRSLGLQ